MSIGLAIKECSDVYTLFLQRKHNYEARDLTLAVSITTEMVRLIINYVCIHLILLLSIVCDPLNLQSVITALNFLLVVNQRIWNQMPELCKSTFKYRSAIRRLPPLVTNTLCLLYTNIFSPFFSLDLME